MLVSEHSPCRTHRSPPDGRTDCPDQLKQISELVTQQSARSYESKPAIVILTWLDGTSTSNSLLRGGKVVTVDCVSRVETRPQE